MKFLYCSGYVDHSITYIAQKHTKLSLNKMRTSTIGSINMQPIDYKKSS